MTLVPSCWTTTTIGSVCEINPPKPTALSDEDAVTFVPMSCVSERSGVIDTSQERTFGELRRMSYRPFANGDVLFAKITPCMENGKIAVAKNLRNQHGFGSTEFHVLRPCDELDAKYLMMFLLQQSVRNEASRHMTGTAGQLRVSTAYLRDVQITLPPVDEQRRIVSVVEEQFSHLGAGNASLANAQIRAGRLADSAYRSLLCGPWATVRLSSIARTSSGGTPSRKIASNFNGSIPWVKSGELGDSLVKHSAERISAIGLATSSAKILKRGTLMMAMYGATVGKLGILDMESATTNQAVCAIEPEDPKLVPFLWFCLRAMRHDIIESAKGGAQPNISQGMIRDLLIPLPPEDERQPLIARIDATISACDRLQLAVMNGSARSDRLRQAILEYAFSGKLRLECAEEGEARPYMQWPGSSATYPEPMFKTLEKVAV